MDMQSRTSATSTGYRFGDRRVVTPLKLSELPACSSEGEARQIRIDASERPDQLPPVSDWLHQWGDGDETSLRLARTEFGYVLRFSGLADFMLDFAEQSIRIRALPSVDDNTLEHLLVDQVLPRFLAHEGELLVHASALTIDGRTALFLGESGWGKSTLAALLHRAGHQLHSDDCVQLQRQGNRYFALPTYPSLRLLADSLDETFPGAGGLAAVAGYSSKRRLPMVPPALATPPIAALYLLDEPSDDFRSVVIDAMRPASACLELMRHSFKLEVADRVRTQLMFSACSEVARSVPAFSLDYPRDYRQSDELVRAITRHLAALPDHGQDMEVPDARR